MKYLYLLTLILIISCGKAPEAPITDCSNWPIVGEYDDEVTFNKNCSISMGDKYFHPISAPKPFELSKSQVIVYTQGTDTLAFTIHTDSFCHTLSLDNDAQSWSFGRKGRQMGVSSCS